MFYDKKIKYLNYIVNGERIKGCGFVKVEIRDRIINLEMSVTGLPPSLHAYTDVCLCTLDAVYPMGQICLENGGGSFRLCGCNLAEMNPTGVIYEDWKGIAIFPEEQCEISAYWGETHKCVLERVEVAKELSAEILVDSRWAGSDGAPVTIDISEDTPEPKPVVEMKEHVMEKKTVAQEKGTGKGTRQSDVGVTRGKVVESGNGEIQEERMGATQEAREQQMRMAEDKWEQISAIYPHIRPFRDKREYLSIRPADFVLLSTESYKAVNNSFLLHGYHNYQHLILARSFKKGEISYYVGTPGNFFEREKQVAIMFGFTGFECAKDPAREGDFGYYLMEVKL